jgi:hypothetical protein
VEQDKKILEDKNTFQKVALLVEMVVVVDI